MKIKSIKKIVLDKPQSYYDISVDKYHNFVINNSIIVHNCFYHHGNVSLENAIITMAQKFKNNMSLLDDIGQFGSLRSPTPGAARYIGTKLNKNFRLLYKDFELLEYKEEEGEEIEPKFFLPIVPTVLINGTSGIAVGFASNILNRNPIDIIDACDAIIKNKPIKNISPYIPQFNGEFIRDNENPKKWFMRGKVDIVNTTTVKVKELPPSMTYEKYEDILDNLVETKQIASYEDNSKENIEYTIKFSREALSKLDNDKLIKLLKLEETSTEIFTTLDEFGKLKIFETDIDIIKYFVLFRLEYYVKRKEYLLDKMKRDLKILANRGRFIKAIIDGKLDIKNRPKEEIIKNIQVLNIEMVDDSYDFLLRMPIWSLTNELFQKLKEDYLKCKADIESFQKIEPKDMYLEDLKELKKKI